MLAKEELSLVNGKALLTARQIDVRQYFRLIFVMLNVQVYAEYVTRVFGVIHNCEASLIVGERHRTTLSSM